MNGYLELKKSLQDVQGVRALTGARSVNMKTLLNIKCPICGKERFMSLGDYNRGRRKTHKCLPCYNHTRPDATGHKDIYHEGYILVYSKNHHRATNTGYVKRCVLIIEEQLSRLLSHEENIHHINGKKDDDRIENLQLLTNSEHVTIHAKQRVLRRSLSGTFI